MMVREPATEWRLADAAIHAAFRTGVYVGAALSLALTAWVLVANRMPFLEPFDHERNLAAATVFGVCALVPILRYLSTPRLLMLCGLVAWAILSFVYRLLCIYFSGLSGIRTPMQVLMLGVLFYLIAATIAWLGALVWRVRHEGERHAHR